VNLLVNRYDRKMLTKNDLQQIRSIVREEVKDEVEQQLKPVSKKLNRVAKDLSYIIGNYDERIVLTNRRVDKIEEHLNLPQVR
jgi:hypothetical protein